MATLQQLEQIHELLDEFQDNYRGIPVIESVLKQVKEALPERASTNEEYAEMTHILPFSLWPAQVTMAQ